MRIAYLIASVCFCLSATAAAAQDTVCENIPLPMEGTYSSSMVPDAVLTLEETAAPHICPTSFTLSGRTPAGAAFSLEFRAAFNQAGQNASFEALPGTSPIGAWPHLDPIFENDFEYLGGIRSFSRFSLIDHLLPENDPRDELAALGEFSLTQGRAAECMCNEITSWIESARRWRDIYADQSVLQAVEDFGLHRNEAEHEGLDFFIRRNSETREAEIVELDLLTGNLPPTLPARFDGLTYQGLVTSIYFENLVVEDGEIRPHPSLGPDSRLIDALGDTVSEDGEPLDLDGDGINDSTGAFLSSGSCSITMPNPNIVTQQCRSSIEIWSTYQHEAVHQEQCRAANALNRVTNRNGSVLNVADPIDEATAVPFDFPNGFARSVEQFGLSSFDMSWPPRRARNEIEAYTRAIQIMSEFTAEYCPDAD